MEKYLNYICKALDMLLILQMEANWYSSEKIEEILAELKKE